MQTDARFHSLCSPELFGVNFFHPRSMQNFAIDYGFKKKRCAQYSCDVEAICFVMTPIIFGVFPRENITSCDVAVLITNIESR